MLTANGNWQWFWEQDSQKLAIKLDDEHNLVTAYGAKVMQYPLTTPLLFNTRHMELYSKMEELVDDLPLDLSVLQRTQIAINGTAALAFHKSTPIKSWYFTPQANDTFSSIATLETESDCALVMVLEHTESFSTCMILSEYIEVTDSKRLNQFDVVKVNCDRLLPIDIQPAALKRA